MVKEQKYFRLPESLLSEQQKNSLARDLYLTDTGELIIEENTVWYPEGRTDDNLLAYCTKDEVILLLAGEHIPVSGDQFFLWPGMKHSNYIRF